MSALLPGIQILIMGMAFALGLAVHPEDFAGFWRQRQQALRSALAMFVGVPLLAVLLVQTLPLSPAASTTLIVLAASSGVPLLPRKLHWLDHSPFAVGLLLHSTLCAALMLPLWIHFAAHPEYEPTALDVFQVMARAYLLPMLGGILIRICWADFAERASARLIRVGNLLLLAALLLAALTQWRLALELKVVNLLALALLSIGALAIGHLLGGPQPKERAALAIACSQRFAGVAVLLSATRPGMQLLVGVLVYVLIARLIELPYTQWQKRRLSTDAAALSRGSAPSPP